MAAINSSMGIGGSGSSRSSSLMDRYPTQVHLYARFEPGILLFDRVVTPIWYIFGLFGNSLSAYVWLLPEVRRNNSSAIYLAALSIWDLVFLLFHTFQELKEAWSISFENAAVCKLLPVVLLTAQYLSPMLVLSFTVERWISICFPFKRGSYCTPRRAVVVVACLCVSTTVWNLWQIHFKEIVDGQCDVVTRGWAWFAYTLATEVCISGVVPTTALVFNLLVIQELRKVAAASGRRQLASTDAAADAGVDRRFRSTTVTLLCVSFFVILTTLPAGLVYGLQYFADFGNRHLTDEQVLQDPVWQRHFALTRIKKVIDEMSISHYSLNFIIYLFTGPQYRRHVRQLFTVTTSSLRCNCGAAAAQRPARKEMLQQREEYYLGNYLGSRRCSRARRLRRGDAGEGEAGAECGEAEKPQLMATYV